MPEWTRRQAEAIEAGGGDVLVSAGAGSGKTAVLVERVIRLVLDPGDPLDLDRLAVVTFTEEAAGEMRRRVRGAIEARLRENGANPRLERQLALLERARISTIHSFCLRLLRENFHRLESGDPLMRVLSNEEAWLLRYEALDAVFEERYEDEGAAGRAFLELIERYGGGRGDEAVRALALKLHELMETTLDPGEWARKALDVYRNPDFLLAAWARELDESAGALAAALRQAAHGVAASDLSARYKTIVKEETNRFEAIAAALRNGALEKAFTGFDGWKLDNLPGGKQSEQGRAAARAYAEPRKQLKKMIEQACLYLPESIRASLERLAPHARAMVELAEAYRERYARAKAAMGALDFHDLERMALTLLRDETGGPSETARECRERFRHVVIDEFQDVNPLQDAIFSLVANERSPNRFMVGDVKQCIYSFRLAEPAIFLERLSRCDGKQGGRAIHMAENFRSRPEIVAAINALFRRILAPALGGLTYGDEDALRAAADYGAAPSEGSKVELILLDKIAEEDGEEGERSAASILAPAALQAEALEAARRIREWTSDGAQALTVLDRAASAPRRARLSDIAILMRGVRGRAVFVADTLRTQGIPVAMASETAFFESAEVRDAMSLLRLIDNPRQDLPLAAALRAPFMALSEDDLAEIRLSDPNAPFHEAAWALAQRNDAPLARRLGQLYRRLERWRTIAREKPLGDLVQLLYEETGCRDYAGGLPDGTGRRARLDALAEYARAFGAVQGATLYRFLRYLEDLAARDIELPAPPLPPGVEAVRLMTIHQSKGLEFPIVFLLDLGKFFNFSDTNSPALFDRDMGIGLQDIDPERGLKRATLPHGLVKDALRARIRAEEARLLYVAMTRARERLVLAGSLNMAKEFEKWREQAGESGQPLDSATLRSARSFLDWIGPALAALPEGAAFDAPAGEASLEPPGAAMRITIRNAASVLAAANENAANPEERPEDGWLERLRGGQPLAADWRADPAAAELARRLDWSYPRAALAEAPAKIGVTEFKRRLERVAAEDEADPPAPFLAARAAAARGAAARERGIWLHDLLRRLDLGAGEMSFGQIERQARALAGRGLLDAEGIDADGIAALERFFATPLGRRMVAERGRLRREAPFCAALPAGDFLGGAAPAGAPPVLIQGVIDALIETDEGPLILDYKTDSIAPEAVAERAEAYRPQLALYTQAAAQAFGRRPAGAALVFLSPGLAREFDVDELLEWRPALPPP